MYKCGVISLSGNILESPKKLNKENDYWLYPRGTSNDAPKQIIVYYRLTIDCCFKISA
jgi:hypothetical protein